MLFFSVERSLPLVNKNLKSNYRTTTECLKEREEKKVNQFVRDEEKGKVLSKNEAGFCLQATQSCILCWKRKWIDTWRDNSLHPSSWRDNYNFHSRTQQFLNNDNSHFRLSTIFHWNIARKFNFQLRRQIAVSFKFERSYYFTVKLIKTWDFFRKTLTNIQNTQWYSWEVCPAVTWDVGWHFDSQVPPSSRPRNWSSCDRPNPRLEWPTSCGNCNDPAKIKQ